MPEFQVPWRLEKQSLEDLKAILGEAQALSVSFALIGGYAAQPKASAFTTFEKHVNTVLAWKKNPELLLKQLAEKESDELLWKSVVEQYWREAV